MKKIIQKTGAIELVPNNEEKAIKIKVKGKKEAKDLTDNDIKELVYVLAKQAGLL